MLLFCFFIGVVIGIIISLSKISYLGLLNVKDKVIINIINGSISVVSSFWECLCSFALPLIIIFLFSLNYYSNFLNYIFFSYQSMLLMLTSLAMIQSYSFSGFLKILLIILPVNLIYFFIMCFWIVACTKRVSYSNKLKKFSAGFDNAFQYSIYLSLFAIFLLSVIVGFIVPLILKSAIFVIF